MKLLQSQFLLLLVFTFIYRFSTEESPVIKFSPTADSITVHWPPTSDNSSSYNVTLEGSNDGRKDSKTFQNSSHTFTNLTPCSDYNVTVFLHNATGDVSELVSTTDKEPSPPVNLSVANTSSTQLTATWEPVEVGNCNISYSLRVNSSVADVNRTVPCSNNSCTIDHLTPFTDYSIEVKAITNNRTGKASEALTMKTSSDKAGLVTNFKCEPEGERKIRCSWQPPAKSNGVISGYVLKYEYEYKSTHFNGENTEPKITQIIELKKPAKTVNITIQAINELGPGNSSELNFSHDFQKASKVIDFQCVHSKDKKNSFECNWTAPSRFTDSITEYSLTYLYEYNSIQYNGTKTSTLNQIIVQVDKPAKYVNITISATDKFGPGEPSFLRVLNELQMPPVNAKLSSILKAAPSSDNKLLNPETQVSLILPNQMDESVGIIRLVTLVVKEDRGEDFEFAPFDDNHTFGGSPVSSTYKETTGGYQQPYEVVLKSLKKPFPIYSDENSPDSFIFILGQESVTKCEPNVYCNGPLKSQTNYHVSLRAYSDDGWRTYGVIKVGTKHINIVTPRKDDSKNSPGHIFGYLLLTVFCILLLVTIYLMYKRKQLCFSKDASSHPSPNEGFSRVKYQSYA